MNTQDLIALAEQHVAGRDEHGQIIFSEHGWQAFCVALAAAQPSAERVPQGAGELTDAVLHQLWEQAERECSAAEEEWEHFGRLVYAFALAAAPKADAAQGKVEPVRTDPTQPWTVEHLKNYPAEAVRVLNERLKADERGSAQPPADSSKLGAQARDAAQKCLKCGWPRGHDYGCPNDGDAP